MGTDIAHYDGLTYWGPIGPSRMESTLDLLQLNTDHRALDIGCGRAELLVRLVERFGVSGLGVDRSSAAIAQAAAHMESRRPGANVSFLAMEASDFSGSEGPYDLVSWLGGPYLGRGYPETIERLSSWVRPGGFLLLGHGFWQTPPPGDYLSETGIEREEFTEHWQNIAVAREAGLTLLYTSVSNRDEWDEFEGRILCNWEQRLAQEPTNGELRLKVEQKRRWNDAQQRWGRDAMGFGLYLFRLG